MSTIRKKIESRLAAWAAWIYSHKYIAIAVMLAINFALGSQLTNLTIDTREESFFCEDDPALIAYNEFRDQFGQDDIFFLALRPEEGISQEFLETLSELHNELEEALPYLDDITSLVNARTVRGQGDELIVKGLMPTPPESKEALHNILAEIEHYPLFENLVISSDKSLAIILIKAQSVLDTSDDDLMAVFDEEPGTHDSPSERTYLSNEQNIEIDTAIRNVLLKYRNRGIDFYLAGNPVFVTEIQKGIEKDLKRMIPLSFLVIILFLSILFRRISGVIYPMLTVFFSLVSMMGIMALWGIPINNAIQILPTFLVVVGVGDSVHILTIFYQNFKKTNDKRQAIIQSVVHTGLPILMTSLTTAGGLLSFIWADVAIVAQLGYVAPVGVMLAFLYTLILLPALIAIFPVKDVERVRKDKLPAIDRLFNVISRETVRRPLLVTGISAAIVLIFGAAALTVHFSHNAMTWLPSDSPIRVSTELLDKKTGGTVMLEVLVDSGKANGLHEPGLLARIEEAGEYIPTLAVHNIKAGKVSSLADVLKESNRALHQDRDEAYRVPDTREMVAQELLLFESSGSDDLQELADSSYRTGRLSILAPFTDSILYKDYLEMVKDYLQRQFPGEGVTLTGHMALFVGITKLFITSMAKSYLIAGVVITIMIVLMIGRINVGLVSIIPNIMPIVMVFGIMGFAKIPLDMATILIGSIVLGLVVDDTIHFLHHFHRVFEQTSNLEEAVQETLATAGKAMVITSLVLCGGFFIYTLSFLANNVRFGFLCGFSIILALAADFLLMPALLTLVYGRREQTVHEAQKSRSEPVGSN